jgi:hypothetical protein
MGGVEEEVAVIDEEIEATKAFDPFPFEGTEPSDARARRQARGAFAREDFEEPAVDPIDSYTGPRTIDEIASQEELSSYIGYSEAKARAEHDGSDALPPYDEVVNRYLVPLVQRQPAALFGSKADTRFQRILNPGTAINSAIIWIAGFAPALIVSWSSRGNL